MNPAFQVGREIGNNFGNAFGRVKDENAIEKILYEASSSDDPKVLQNSIGKILSQVSPERQAGALQYLQNAYTYVRKKKDEEKQFAREKEAGFVPGLNPNLQAAKYKEDKKNQRFDAANQAFNAPGMPQQPTLPQDANGMLNPNEQQIQSQPQTNSQPQQTPKDPLKEIQARKQQLLPLTGHPDIEVKNRATAELKNLDTQEKLLQKANIENKKIEREDKKISRDEELQFHKESDKFDEELRKTTRIARRQVDTVKDITKAIDSGNIKPVSFSNILKEFGPIGELAAKAFLNEDQATLQSSIPSLLEGWKEVFGVRLTDADLKVLQDKLPDIGKSKEANKAIVRIINKYADQTLLRGKIAQEIKEKNNGIRPLGYADKIEQRYEEMIKPVNIRNPTTGRVIPIPAYEASDYIKAGGELVNE